MLRKLKLKNAFIDTKLKEYSESSCLLTISVGQDYHENEKFLSTIWLVNENFKSCKMLIVDTLQRHTMALNSKMASSDFIKSALKEGDLWLLRNEKYYSMLNNFEGFVRWDHWLSHDRYQLFYNLLSKELQNNNEYMTIFNKVVNSYIKRYMLRLNNLEEFDRERAYNICFSYIHEECAAYCLWPDLGCDFEVYPVRRNAAMIETYSKFIFNDSKKIYPLDIQFRKDSAASPQIFYSMKE
jgi:hypothetical protein